MEVSKAEVEYLAKAKYGPTARVSSFTTKHYEAVDTWHALKVDGEIIGCRRSLKDLVLLVNRGRLMEVLT